MTINLTQTIKNLKGQIIKDGESDVTLGAVLAEALATDQTGSKMKLFMLAQICYTHQTIMPTTEEFTLMKSALERCTSYGGNIIVIGQAQALLEQSL